MITIFFKFRLQLFIISIIIYTLNYKKLLRFLQDFEQLAC